MPPPSNPYDELPYRSLPIEWTAPERLALASVLQAGPRSPVDSYRVLELGCGDGSNLLPLAYYRRDSSFVGVDGARTRVEVAEGRRMSLGLTNVRFVSGDFGAIRRQVSGRFDYVIAHGVFSWVSDDVRDALFGVCSRSLRTGGLLYLNYNSMPGWNVRGLVRRFLLSQTAPSMSLPARAERARILSARAAVALDQAEHPFSQLLANEFRFVSENHVSHTAHEYLAENNHAYWRSEFLALAGAHGLDYVGDADFSYDTSRVPEDLLPRLAELGIDSESVDDAADLLCYRQLHTPILTLSPFVPHPLELAEFEKLFVASQLTPKDSAGADRSVFQHPNGYTIETRPGAVREAIASLHTVWPRGVPVLRAFPDLDTEVMDDLRLLQRNGLIELRCAEPSHWGVDPEPLNALEKNWGGYRTTAYHTLEPAGHLDMR